MVTSAAAAASPMVWRSARTMSASAHTCAPPIHSQRAIVHTGTPSGEQRQCGERRLARESHAAQAMWCRARCAPEPILANRALPRAAASADQQHQAQQHQHAGQRAARRAVEGGLELLEDRRGERGEAQHRERAVLGEQVHADQQSAAEDREPQLRQHHPAEDAPPGRNRARGRIPRSRGPAGAAWRRRARRRTGSTTASRPARPRRIRAASGRR